MKEYLEFGQLNHETIIQIPHLALFIDNDEPNETTFPSWEACFSEIGCKLMWVGTPESCMNLAEAMKGLGPKIELAIADQFNGDTEGDAEMIEPCTYLLLKLRQTNPSCWIMEASYTPIFSRFRPVNSNTVMNSAEDRKGLQQEIVKVAKTMPNAPLYTLFSYACNVNGLLAQNVEAKKYTVDHYYIRLTKNNRFFSLLSLIGINREQFDICYDSLSEDSRRALLHRCFQVLSHLDANRSEDYYSMPLDRLNSLINQIRE